ncbi:MAG TPA: ankyrin repeat domain-containing protein, partial [Ktedonobacteraceae bacterium]|nr:ankyrin repeat domain-containing protein [Ktedonobacteraceae bacterium]
MLDARCSGKARQTLIALGLPPFCDARGREWFFRCAKKGDLAAVQAYLTLGMSLELHDQYSEETPLIRAVEGNHTELIRFLLEARADLEARDRPGDTALMTSVNWQHTEALTVLLEAGADLHTVSNANRTPLASAVEKENKKIVRILLAAGADVNQIVSDLSVLDFAPVDGDLTITRMLIKRGARINRRRGREKCSYLMSAIKQGKLALVDLYLETGADIHTTNHFGWTTWMVAMDKGYTDLAERLLAMGASSAGQELLRFFQAARDGNLE